MDTGDVQELQMDRKGRVRKPFSPMFLIGNLLIVGGLVLLIGIGGWYAFQSYTNNQFQQELAAKGGELPTPLPGLVAQDLPSPTPEPTTPPPKLPSSPTLTQWTGVVKQQTASSPPVRLVIPSVAIDTKIVPIDWKMIPSKNGNDKPEWQVADFAVGHHDGTADPGQLGNVVLSGHVDYKGEVFKNLHNVNKGDEVVVYTQSGQYVYVITQLVLVQEDGVSEAQQELNARYMDPTPDQTLTMITCWPYGIDNYRFIAIAKPYQSSQSAQSEFILR